ncbi:MAG: hypothetical protein ABSG77_00720 [Candidatus Acidiferrum sp.]|jgi:hypothetical protein
MNSFCFLGYHLDWPNLIAGLILGLFGGYLIHVVYHWRQGAAKARNLCSKYGKLARTYSNFRADGVPTGGSVRLVQNQDGSFEVVGFHANGSVDWKSLLWMDEKYDNRGITYYLHEAGQGYGVQIIRYLPEQDILQVKGVRESPGPPLEFFHTWRPKT